MSRPQLAGAPCTSCPYRRDVPSGVWTREEYEKLPRYDAAETFMQPTQAFHCHKGTGDLCAGWVGCHDMDNSLGLRMAFLYDHIDEQTVEAALDYVSPVPLFSSGQEACEHGLTDLAHPSERAIAAMDGYLRRKRRRRSA